MVADTKKKKKTKKVAKKTTTKKATSSNGSNGAAGTNRVKATRDGAKSFKITLQKKMLLHMTIMGSTPLLVHRMSDRALNKIAGGQDGTIEIKSKKEPRIPVLEYRECMYFVNDGSPELIDEEWSDEARAKVLALGGAYKKRGEDVHGFPVIAVYKAMKRACKYIAGLSMADAPAMFRIRNDGGPVSELSELKYSANMMRRDRVVLQGKIATVTYRSQYDNWSMNLAIEFSPDMIQPEIVANVVSRAGSVGIGAWRPEKDGIFGQFYMDPASVMLTEELRK